MNPEILFPFVAIVTACALGLGIYLLVTRTVYSRYCEYCGKPLRRGPWQIVGYSQSTGRPARHERYVWCETQSPEYDTPRPPPLPMYDWIGGGGHRVAPDDPTFKNSHHHFTERRGR